MSTSARRRSTRWRGDYDAASPQRGIGRLMREAVWRRLDARSPRAPGARARLRDRRGRRAPRPSRGPCRGDRRLGRRWCASRARRSWPPGSATPSTCASPRSRPGCARCRRGPERHPVRWRAFQLRGAQLRDRPGAVVAALAHAVRPGGWICCVMGPLVPWEWGWYLAHGRPDRAFRRLQPGGVTGAGLGPVSLGRPRGVGVRAALPRASRGARRGAAAADRMPRHGRAAIRAARRPRALGAAARDRAGPRARLADHYLIELERTERRSTSMTDAAAARSRRRAADPDSRSAQPLQLPLPDVRHLAGPRDARATAGGRRPLAAASGGTPASTRDRLTGGEALHALATSGSSAACCARRASPSRCCLPGSARRAARGPDRAVSCDDVIVSLDGPRPVHDLHSRRPRRLRTAGRGIARRRAPHARSGDHRPAARCSARTSAHLRDTVAGAHAIGSRRASAFSRADVTSEAFNRPGGWDDGACAAGGARRGRPRRAGVGADDARGRQRLRGRVHRREPADKLRRGSTSIAAARLGLAELPVRRVQRALGVARDRGRRHGASLLLPSADRQRARRQAAWWRSQLRPRRGHSDRGLDVRPQPDLPRLRLLAGPAPGRRRQRRRTTAPGGEAIMTASAVVLYNPRAVFYTMPLALLAVGSHLDPERYEVRHRRRPARSRSRSPPCSRSSTARCASGLRVLTGQPDSRRHRRSPARREARCPRLPVVWGGWHPSLFGRSVCEEAAVDVTVQAQGEATFAEIWSIADRAADAPWTSCAGCTVRDARTARIVHEPAATARVDLDAVCAPRLRPAAGRALLRAEGQAPARLHLLAGLPLPLRLLRRSLRLQAQMGRAAASAHRRGAGDALAALSLHRRQFPGRDLLHLAPRASKPSPKSSCSRGRPITWAGDDARRSGRAPARRRCWPRCRRSGLRRVIVGVEAGSQAMLDWIKKDIKLEQVFVTAEKCRRHGIAVKFPFIVGFPDESDESIARPSLDVASGCAR